MEVLEPDEVIMDSIGTPELNSDVILAEIDRLVKQGRLRLQASPPAGLPMLALGAAGGILGATLFRGTLGLVVGGGLAWWAWSQLK